MSIDLSTLSRRELVDLRSQLDAAIESAEQREKEEALKAVEKAAAEYGFTLSEITGAAKPASARRAKSAAKYRNPENPAETWSGRGRKPQWIHAALTKGLDISDLEI
jgi:DNA-binding protein H-NS